MKKLLIAALLGCAAMPAQAFPLFLETTISGSWWIPKTGSTDHLEFPIGPFTTTLELVGSWSSGYSSYYVQCNSPGCMKATFEGNTITLRAFGSTGALPCYCGEAITLTFDRPVSDDIELFTGGHFISGTYSFSESTYAGGRDMRGTISAAAVPEPATWAMMIAGFGLAGAALRKRKATVAFA